MRPLAAAQRSDVDIRLNRWLGVDALCTPRCQSQLMDPLDTVRRYAEAWQANDISAVLAMYHDDFVLHYFGESPLAGDHVGRNAAIEVLMEATARSGRQLDAIEDVLGGERFAAIIAREGVGEPSRIVRRLFVYTVRDSKLAECWLYDEDQRFVDRLWSAPNGES